MESLLYALKLAGVLLAMTTIVPLWIGFATGSLARAWAAWRGYLLIIGVIGGGGALFGVLAALVDHISR
ncbi:MAG: hypothetical protein RLZZ182_1572 [Pseudomonadota bacterium]